MRREGKRALGARPYSTPCTQTITSGGCQNARAANRFIPGQREVKNSLYIVIAGDRGLAGGYNANLFKLAAAEMQGKQAQVITIGKKAQGITSDPYPGKRRTIRHCRTIRISDTHPIVEDL